jgi:hypothetical protein
MIGIVKNLRKYVYLKNLGLSRGEVGFSRRNNHVPVEKEF